MKKMAIFVARETYSEEARKEQGLRDAEEVSRNHG